MRGWRHLWIIGVLSLVSIGAPMGGSQSPRGARPPALRRYDKAETSFIKALVDRISEKELQADVLALERMGTRYAPSQGNLRAAGYIRQSFLSDGLADAALDEFVYYDDETGQYETTRNVVASKRGVKTPEKIIVVGAHFDTITRSADTEQLSSLDKESPSPGADDNGTGVAAVLAAARLLSAYSFDSTLRFVAFSAEEAGILGSAHYAARAARARENIVAMIDLDMLGHVKEDPEDIDILANDGSVWLLDEITNNAPVYAPDLLIYRTVDPRYDGSDHAPFWNNGYPAVCFMDDYYPSSRLYHTPKDTADTLDSRFFLNSTRLAIGTLAELAGIQVASSAPAPPELAGPPRRVDWSRDSGMRFLFTLRPSINQVNVIDVSLPNVSSKASLSLGDIPPETWGQPRYYPVAAERRPASRLVYVPLIRLRATGRETERGVVKVVDPRAMRVLRTVAVGRYPTAGCFNATGTRYYQPYQAEQFIDVFGAATFARIGRISTPVPLNKLAVDATERRAIGISAETNSIVIIDLIGQRVERVMTDVTSPRDVAMATGDVALVCSYDRGTVYAIDLEANAVAGKAEAGERPVRLIMSPKRNLVACLHRNASHITTFEVARTGEEPILQRRRVLELGEVVTDGAFAEGDVCYFVSESRSRLFSIDLAGGKALWAMRTGGTRASADTGRIVYVGR